MNVQELIEKLSAIEDKSLPIRLAISSYEDDGDLENYWLDSIEVHMTGNSGYELHGEVKLIGVD